MRKPVLLALSLAFLVSAQSALAAGDAGNFGTPIKSGVSVSFPDSSATFQPTPEALELLEKMGDTGKAYPLIEGSGVFYGLFIVEKISKTKTEFFNDGAARRIEFSAKFTRVDDNDRGLLGILNVSDIDFGSTLGGLL